MDGGVVRLPSDATGIVFRRDAERFPCGERGVVLSRCVRMTAIGYATALVLLAKSMLDPCLACCSLAILRAKREIDDPPTATFSSSVVPVSQRGTGLSLAVGGRAEQEGSRVG